MKVKRLLFLMGVLVLLLCGCDGASWENNICAKSYPQEAVLTIPFGARVNQGDYLAYGGYRFTAEPGVVQNVNNWAVLQGMSVQMFEDSIGSGVVIENEGNYFFLGALACEEDDIYEFSGMQRSIKTYKGSIPVLLPLHLVSDPFIRSSMSARIESGECYKIKDNVTDLNETVEQFFAFYASVYGSDVSMKDGNIVLTGDHGEITFSFSVQDEEQCFAVNIA